MAWTCAPRRRDRRRVDPPRWRRGGPPALRPMVRPEPVRRRRRRTDPRASRHALRRAAREARRYDAFREALLRCVARRLDLELVRSSRETPASRMPFMNVWWRTPDLEADALPCSGDRVPFAAKPRPSPGARQTARPSARRALHRTSDHERAASCANSVIVPLNRTSETCVIAIATRFWLGSLNQ